MDIVPGTGTCKSVVLFAKLGIRLRPQKIAVKLKVCGVNVVTFSRVACDFGARSFRQEGL